MKFVSGKELQGVLIAISSWLLISASINAILGSWFLHWPWLLIPLSLALFLTAKMAITKLPLIGNEQSFIGQTVHIILVIFFYSIFVKSLFYYLDPLVSIHKWALLALGFIAMLYAVKYHLVARDGGIA